MSLSEKNAVLRHSADHAGSSSARHSLPQVEKITWFKKDREREVSIARELAEERTRREHTKKIVLVSFVIIVLLVVAAYVYRNVYFVSFEERVGMSEKTASTEEMDIEEVEEGETALEQLETLETAVKPMAVIMDTPTGWLNVRNGPGTSYERITRVEPGERFEIIEESGGWFNILLKDGRAGWITSQYADKKVKE